MGGRRSVAGFAFLGRRQCWDGEEKERGRVGVFHQMKREKASKTAFLRGKAGGGKAWENPEGRLIQKLWRERGALVKMNEGEKKEEA